MSGASRSTRSRMSSRMSSPFVNTLREPPNAQTSTPKAREPHKSTSDAWVEPELPQPAPSFVGDKLARQGVLENMLPLGSLPTGKAKPKSRMEGSVFASPLRNGDESGFDEAVHTTLAAHTLSPSPQINHGPSTSEERVMNSIYPRDREDDDGEYRPMGVRRPSLFASRLSSTSTPTSAPQFPTRLIRPDVVQKAVQELKERTLHHVAASMEQVFSHSQNDPHVTGIFDAIISEKPTRQQSSAFKHLIKSLIPSTGKRAERHQENRRHSHSISPTVARFQNLSPSKRSGSTSLKVSPNQNHNHNQNHSEFDMGLSSHRAPIEDPSPTVVNRKITLNLNGGKKPSLPPQSPLRIDFPSSPSPPPTSNMQDLTNGTIETARESLTHDRAPSSPLSNVSDNHDINDLALAISPSPESSSADAAPNHGRTSAKPPPKRRQIAGPSVGSHTKRAATKASKSNGKLRVNNVKDPEAEAKLQERKEFLQQLKETRKRDYPEAEESALRTEPHPKRLKPSSSPDSLAVPPPGSLRASVAVEPPSTSTTPGPSTRSNLLHLRNGVSRKRSRDVLEADDSSLSPAPDEGLVSPTLDDAGPSSRLATPKFTPRPSKQVKKSARIIVSPNKRNSTQTITAGMPTPIGETQEASGGNGETAQENNDFCSACKGNGTLLCCDGCPRSFHFTCCDPPIHPDFPPSGNWLCMECESLPHHPESKSKLFASMLAFIDKQNPSAFQLPEYERNYFEAVKTGEDGEYETVNNGRRIEPLQIKRKLEKDRNGYGQPTIVPDTLATHDIRGNLVTCYRCQKTSEGHREIIACDYCPAYWHLDCTDPPMAVAPKRKPRHDENEVKDPEKEKEREKERVGFKCPLHADKDLSEIGNSGRGYSFENPALNAQARTSANVRLPQLRRPKQARIVDVTFDRAFRNNGLIEVDHMPDDFQEFDDVEMNGILYRIPEMALRMDFIERAKRDRYAMYTHVAPRIPDSIARAQTNTLLENSAGAETNVSAKRLLAEVEAVHTLAQMSHGSTKDSRKEAVEDYIAHASPEHLSRIEDAIKRRREADKIPQVASTNGLASEI